ncbi:hypothetical protein KYC5002_25150 [Archangium violaceum]|uniref:hypothetical protein n=1 Tax=Archangium violaceum TaxID=83451 RepID=UPI002B2B4E0F|nr:hypothetical protein KYC5002_25150 [Archangium gephyra]
MPRKTLHVPVAALLSGLMLSACGGVPEEGVAPAGAEAVGTRESAMCSLMSVTNLTVEGLDSYDHVAAGAGAWTVSPSTNSVYMEFWFDNEPNPNTQRITGTYDPATGKTNGRWSYSRGNVSCGAHRVVIKAFPRNISSNGNEEVCSTPWTITRDIYQDCGTPQLNSLYCSRYPNPPTSPTVRCDAFAGGGAGGYTYWWRTNGGGWVQGQSHGSQFFNCPASGYYTTMAQYQVKVVDSAGRESGILTSPTFYCGQ